MSMILKKIVEYKKDELLSRRREFSLKDVYKRAFDAQPARDFKKALKCEPFAIIAEIKKASPSLGVIRQDFDPVLIASQYEEHGAQCLSVLTDEHFFQGHLDFLNAIKKYVSLPCLRKDFTLDEYHVAEARAFGADAVLLIAAILEDAQLKDYRDLIHELGMSCLVEVHDQAELVRVNKISPDLVGVNNRNLKTFEVDLENSLSLLPNLPAEAIKISESGLKKGSDLKRLSEAGFQGFLIGESFMKEKNPGLALANILREVAQLKSC